MSPKPFRSRALLEAATNAADDPLYPFQWAPAAVNAPEAWSAGFTGRGVRVAILDGGLFGLHPDLAPNIDIAASRSFVPGFAWNADAGQERHQQGVTRACCQQLRRRPWSDRSGP